MIGRTIWSEYDPLNGSSVKPNSTKSSSLIGRGGVACTLPLCARVQHILDGVWFTRFFLFLMFGLGLALSLSVLPAAQLIHVRLSWTEEIWRLPSSTIYRTWWWWVPAIRITLAHFLSAWSLQVKRSRLHRWRSSYSVAGSMWMYRCTSFPWISWLHGHHGLIIRPCTYFFITAPVFRLKLGRYELSAGLSWKKNK